MPKISAINVVTDPDNPKSNINAKPMTNGGVMIGKTVKVRRSFLYRNPDRVTTNAKIRPNIVVIRPTSTARNNEFHATPHRPPHKQPRPHKRSSKNFDAKTIAE